MSQSEYSRKVQDAFHKWIKSDAGAYSEEAFYGLEIGFSAGYEVACNPPANQPEPDIYEVLLIGGG